MENNTVEIYYRVNNVSQEVVSWPWVIGLLSAEERRQLEQFKRSPEFLGVDDADKQVKKKTPDAIKLRPFFERLDKGVMFEESYKGAAGTEVKRVLKWCLGPNYDKIKKNSGGIYVLRDLCQRHKIYFDSSESIDDLIEKVKKKFGSNSTILTKTQIDESGLRQIVVRTVMQTKGRDPKATFTEGVLELQQITPAEAFSEAGIKETSNAYTTEVGLEDLSYKELQGRAKEMGINIFGKSREDLIQLLG